MIQNIAPTTQGMTGTVTLSDEIISAVAIVGKIVTHGDAQYRVHSVEGADWYTFDKAGETVLDFFGEQAYSAYHCQPVASLLPMGATIGDGLSLNVPVTTLRRGVSLSKTYR